jgi:hypothetical protein
MTVPPLQAALGYGSSLTFAAIPVADGPLRARHVARTTRHRYAIFRDSFVDRAKKGL